MTSQGADVLTYAAAIQTHAGVYDGFLVKTPGGMGRIRRCGPALPKGDPRQTIRNIGAPVIEVVAQGEIGPDYQREDSDQPKDRFRIYEVAGAAHIDKWAYRELPTMEDQLAATGAPGQGTPAWPFNVKCDPEIPLQEHPLLKYIFDGAFVNLEQWASKGIAPPRAERITIKDGVVQQSNFYDYHVPRMNEIPDIHIELIATDNHPTGAGQMATPLVAPAIGNAVAALTGVRLRQAPMTPDRVLAAIKA
jgi:hypothetical protein